MVTGVISLDNAQCLVIKKVLKDLGLESISDLVELIMLNQAPPQEIIRLINIVYQQAWMDATAAAHLEINKQLQNLLPSQEAQYAQVPNP